MLQTGGYRLDREETMSLFEFPASKENLIERLRAESEAIAPAKRKPTRRARGRKRSKRKTRRK